jgi:hypothetical protein
MAVDPSCRGRGVARMLCNAVLRECVLSGASLLFLTTGNVMRGARALYEALGFELVQRSYVEMFDNLVCRYEMVVGPGLRARYRDSVSAVREAEGGRALEVVADCAVVLARAREPRQESKSDESTRGLLLDWLARRKANERWRAGGGDRARVVVRVMKRGEDNTQVRQLFAAAWQSYYDAWERADPAIAEMVQMIVILIGCVVVVACCLKCVELILILIVVVDC